MDKFPLELVSVFFTKTIVTAIPAFDPAISETKDMAPINSINFAKAPSIDNIDDDKSYTFAMRTVLNPDKLATCPYFIDIECFAVFTVVGDISDEEIEKAVTITGHSVVYGAIRETVNWITGRHINGGLFLGLSVLTPKSKKQTED